MELHQLLNKVSIVALQALSILFQVHDGSRLGPDLIDVQVVLPRNLIAGLGTLNTLALLLPPILGCLLGRSESILDAEVVVAALLRPKLLQCLPIDPLKNKRLFLTFESILDQGIHQL